jgi:hypothetical protein
MAREHDVAAVPTLVVAGRYSTSPTLAGPDVLAVVDALVAEEARRTPCAGSRCPAAPGAPRQRQ